MRSSPSSLARRGPAGERPLSWTARRRSMLPTTRTVGALRAARLDADAAVARPRRADGSGILLDDPELSSQAV